MQSVNGMHLGRQSGHNANGYAQLVPVTCRCRKLPATARHDRQEETTVCIVSAANWGLKALQHEIVIENDLIVIRYTTPSCDQAQLTG